MLIKHKWYRWLQAIFGARSFIKENEDGTTAHALVKGNDSRQVVEVLSEQGFIEEWPKERINGEADGI